MKKGQTAKEKRLFSRVPFGVKAEMKAEGRVYPSESVKNLSVGGCLLPVKCDLAPGTPCEVKILMFGAKPEVSVEAEGRIVRCDDGVAAVQFLSMDVTSRFHLQNIIRFNSEDPELVEREIMAHS